jgi:hypothetical protein
MLTAIATTNKRLRIFPTPKYIKARSKDREVAVTKPRREFPKSRENVKRRLTKDRTKKRGTAKIISGSTK